MSHRTRRTRFGEAPAELAAPALPPLPAAGTYSVFVEPYSYGKGAATGSFTLLVDSGIVLTTGASVDGSGGTSYVVNGTAAPALLQ